MHGLKNRLGVGHMLEVRSRTYVPIISEKKDINSLLAEVYADLRTESLCGVTR